MKANVSPKREFTDLEERIYAAVEKVEQLYLENPHITDKRHIMETARMLLFVNLNCDRVEIQIGLDLIEELIDQGAVC
jgi:hypothetical protein